MKLEVVIVPVANVDRTKEFYKSLDAKRVAIMSHAYDTRSADRWSDEGGPVPTEAGTRDGA